MEGYWTFGMKTADLFSFHLLSLQLVHGNKPPDLSGPFFIAMVALLEQGSPVVQASVLLLFFQQMRLQLSSCCCHEAVKYGQQEFLTRLFKLLHSGPQYWFNLQHVLI